MNRRRFLRHSAAAIVGLAAARRGCPVWAQHQAPAVVTPDRLRPQIPYGVQSGDVTGDRAVVWSRSDRAARLVVEWATNDAFRDARRVTGPAALAPTDFTARIDLIEFCWLVRACGGDVAATCGEVAQRIAAAGPKRRRAGGRSQ